MASGSTTKKRVKTLGTKGIRRGPELNGWISDNDAQSQYLDCWKMRSLVTHEFLKLKFFKDEGFISNDGLDVRG